MQLIKIIVLLLVKAPMSQIKTKAEKLVMCYQIVRVMQSIQITHRCVIGGQDRKLEKTNKQKKENEQ